jgi:CRISPR-associated endonuclease/helicase Cas3
MILAARMPFPDMVRQAAGHDPYPYQQRLADEGLPDLLRMPTGAGKTLAATLPWLYRRRYHADPAVRRATPRWLVLVLPQRALVEQTVGVVTGWLDALGLGDSLPVHVLTGGVSLDDRSWKTRPGNDAIFVGTQDMVLSRLLMRGYAEPRAAWPMAFGLLHSGAQFVFDEVQLMGPALPTSLQLEGLRGTLGTTALSRSMWMSATVDPERLRTPDYAGPHEIVELSDDDRVGALQRRLQSTRTIEYAPTARDAKRYAPSLADVVLARHGLGTRTIVVLNTVERATTVYDALAERRPDADLVLLHSRFRPAERAAATLRRLRLQQPRAPSSSPRKSSRPVPTCRPGCSSPSAVHGRRWCSARVGATAPASTTTPRCFGRRRPRGKTATRPTRQKI